MPRLPRSEPTERQREWLGNLQVCRGQGVSLKAYAEQQGLNLQRLYHWHRRLKRLGLVRCEQTVSFAAVRVCKMRGVGGVQRPHFPNGVMLEWEGHADLALVEHLLGVSSSPR